MQSYPKNPPFRSKIAIKWFRKQECDCCGLSGEGKVTGHHEPLNGHGTSSKGPDDEQIPLCFGCHRLRHDIGRASFYERGCIDWRRVVKRYKKLFSSHLECYKNQITGPY